MPCFDFENRLTGEIVSVYLTLNEPREAYSTQIIEGKEYKRVYSAPLAAKDILKGDMTKEDFRRNTSGKNYSVGDMYDISKEMSKERAGKNGGKDPIQEKFYSDYEKRMGRQHSDVEKRKKREQLEKQMGIKISD